jgi:iron complex outermembrane receptor protein
VFRQTRVPGSFVDYLAAPPAYTLVNLSMGTDCKLGKQQLGIVLGVTNLFNTRYRDYMNRFRYFTDEVGRNVVLQLKWKL